MYGYEYWFDADNKPHDIRKMEDAYIANCIKQLKNCLDAWHGVIPERLTEEELSRKNIVLSKAWFSYHGINYINAFLEELERRKKEN